MSLQLYSYFRSSSAFRVRIALNLKGLNYEYIPVHLLEDGGQQNKPEFLKLNAKGEVPLLIHDGKPLSQSMAIIEYLDEVFPDRHLLFPVDPYLKSQVRAACELINSGTQPLQNLRTLQALQKDFDISEDQKLSWIQKWVGSGLKSYEALIKTHCKEFSFGDHITAADLFLIPQVFTALRFNMKIEDYPKINSIFNNCKNIDEFMKASPSQQPDTPKD